MTELWSGGGQSSGRYPGHAACWAASHPAAMLKPNGGVIATKKANSNKVVLALFGAVALAGLSCSAYAQPAGGPGQPGGMPTGTYQRTCIGASLSQWPFELSASCKANNGTLRVARLDLRTCHDNGDIGNNNGQLQCAAVNAPPGTYRQSCYQVDFKAGGLEAYCKTEAGGLQGSGLDVGACVPGSDIGNNNGVLACQCKPGVPCRATILKKGR
jgi:hypothetical protein